MPLKDTRYSPFLASLRLPCASWCLIFRAEANGATFSARKQRREKQEQVTSLQATIQSQNELLRKRRELNASLNRSRQAAEGKVAELETKLKETQRNALDIRNIKRSLKFCNEKLAALENKLKENKLLLLRMRRNRRSTCLPPMSAGTHICSTLKPALRRKDKEINQRNQEIEKLRKMLEVRARVLPSYVQVHDANEKLQKEKERHALTSQSLQHMTVKLRSLKAKITLSDYHTQSRFHSLDQELQVLENTSQEMKSKNIQHVTELEKQLSSRDKQISDLERDKEFQYRNRKKQYEEIVCRVEELEAGFPAHKRRKRSGIRTKYICGLNTMMKVEI
ncbi:hypothetical protein CPB85DRAFT_1254315 [Mucidula mucida]|nr:hypothetical protein CPB85DRAFT_1254315 [Mucidula mucida]